MENCLPTSVSETLIAGRSLIANSDNWIKNYDALNSEGLCKDFYDGTEAKEFEPCRYDMRGALSYASGFATETCHSNYYYKEAMLELSRTIQPEANDFHTTSVANVTCFNDRPQTTHAMVLEVMDKTIARLQAKEA